MLNSVVVAFNTIINHLIFSLMYIPRGKSVMGAGEIYIYIFIFQCCANGEHLFSSGGSASHGVIKKSLPRSFIWICCVYWHWQKRRRPS